MQGETRLAKQGVARFDVWRNGVLMLAALMFASLTAGVAHAQRGVRNQPPVITLSASAEVAKLGGSVMLTADASDPDGTVVRVVFYSGGVQIAQDSTAPYTYAFSPATPGTYKITAVATDNMLSQTTSAPVVITVAAGGNQSPTVSLTSSQTTMALGSATLLSANAADADGSVAKVVFMNNGAPIAVVTSSPFQFNYYPSAVGSFTLTAVATDDSGASTTSNAVALTVNTDPPPRGGNKPPVVSLSASATSVLVNSTVSLTANASDADGAISKVEFYNGSTLLANDATSPYTADFTPTAAGTYTMTARAYDNFGAASVSNTVSIVAGTAPPASQLPRVSLSLSNTLFAPGSVLTVSGSATATAPGATVARVSFYMNGAKLVDDTTTPYGTTVPLASPGTYLFFAEVADSLGQIVSTLNQKVVVQNAPAVATTDADVWRLLNQATFGASQAEAARVNTLGIPGWINDQMAQPVSGYPDSRYNRIQIDVTPDCTTQRPNNGGNYPPESPEAMCARDHLSLAMVQRDFFTNAVYAPDQLRQRVAWALSQIVVTSGEERDLSYAHVMSRFQNIMFEEAFGNYESLLRKVTYNPAMGNYLDMVNNDRAPAPPTTSTRVPNENYAREIMQLFSINLVELKDDGTPYLDAQGKPVPTYSQTDIAEFAKVFTGYTYASAANPDAPANAKNFTRYYGAPMVPYPTTNTTGHDPNAKTLLNGTVLDAGQTAQQDIDAAVRNVFMHPNTGVYVGKQLIQHLVTGNPSPAYVARITAVFNNNGSNVRGDLAAVVRAILLDPEARGPAKSATDFGSLKEPVQLVTGLIRALNGVTDGNSLEGATRNLDQRPYYSPTVFNYYMPDSKVPGTSILGPEFGIHTTVTAVGRANLVYQLVYTGYNPNTSIAEAAGTKLFLAPFEAVAEDPTAMVALINQHLAGGQFPAAMEPTIVTAVTAITMSATPTDAQRRARAQMAVYLMATSYDYQVQR
ncbi:MAG: DUF1800 family protein [Burkholderiales bacterium]|nr:DUF1800 family protein [Burkholderiales bacterium]